MSIKSQNGKWQVYRDAANDDGVTPNVYSLARACVERVRMWDYPQIQASEIDERTKFLR